MTFDMSPRRVWFGTTVPGKKMVRMISSSAGIDRGRELIGLYEGEPHRAFFAVACALHALPELGGVGPAFRDLRKPLLPAPAALYGATLTDIRDFLKLRFRATGVANVELASPQALLQDLAADRLPPNVEPARPDLAINYAVSALDALSRERGAEIDFRRACRNLRDLFRDMSKSWNPRADDASDELEDKLFEEQ
jgi:hypothetical protein